ncbi:MAG: NAD(P)H-dependent oxidoreductase subunit E [Vulcanimicrobiaceae bacterium]
MDLHYTSATATPEERSAVDALLGTPVNRWGGGKEARDRRHLLLPALHAVQDRIGWVSGGALNYVCERLSVPPAEAYGVATFYAMFSTTPRAPVVVHVCDDIACLANGADEVCAAMESACGAAGMPSQEGRVTWLRSPCLGLCERAPAALVVESGERPAYRSIAPIRADDAPSVAARGAAFSRNGAAKPQSGGFSKLRLLRRVGHVDPESIDEYRAHDGYLALRQAIELGPEGVIREVTASKLMGRGGAAFPTGRKMDAVAKAAVRPHYLICNADESEPGTFKDRVLMEYDPFAVIESMTISAFAAGCEQGYIYIRGEYPLATQRLTNAIEQARVHGLLGDDVMGKGFRFDIELRRGAGAYICGEETALFNSIEGKRGEPRNKPPFPAQAGLFGKPTLVNNVETLACLPHILLEGGDAFAQIGTENSTGPKLFCLSGCVNRPGLYEVPFGTTLGQLIDLAGGIRNGRKLRTVLLGGAAGSFVGPDTLEMPLTFEGTRAAGTTLGSGVIMAFDDSVDLTRVLHRIASFFRDESCGQCVPCRVGTVRQEEALHRLAHATDENDRKREVALINEIARAMRDASICGLGQTAASAVESALTLRLLSDTGTA